MRPVKPKVEDIDGLATLLKEAGVDFGAEDVADALWLAGHMGDLSGIVLKQQRDSGRSGTQVNIREEFIDDDTDDESRRAQISLPTRQSQGRDGSQSKSGIAIKAPAAPALRIRLDLARALRPLRRQVPSPGQLEFDEAATLDQIADQQVWFPVLKPALERWLEVALVVEAMPSLPLWHETIGEFQTLLERQGAFRRVTTWRLETEPEGKPQLFPHWRRPPNGQIPRRAGHLWDAAGRRLILLVSDCTSDAWYNGSMVRWLEKSGHQAPTAVIQLLPEALWSQSALAQGTSMWLSALDPGTVSAKLTSRPRVPLLQQLLALTEAQPKLGVTVPIVTLEAEPLNQWANVVVGAGDSQTLGVQFDRATAKPAEVSLSAPASPSAEERVQRFRTTASLTAQRLAELMAAAPVSPLIVDLIRQTLLPRAEPVHVAEVYMGGLMAARELASAEGEKTTLEYDFAPGVRTILADALSRTKTESVLDAVSRYISERLGLNTRSFEALLRFDFQGDPSAQDLVLPFAEIAIPTLRRMGCEYAEIAEQLGIMPKITPSPSIPDPDDLFPLLQTFTFREATIVFGQQLNETSSPDVAAELELLKTIEDEIERYGLTSRESTVWRLQRQNKTHQEIADELFVTVNTIKRHLKNISAKRKFSEVTDVIKLDSVRYGLTERETEVWIFYQLEYAAEEIARELDITLNTVVRHLKNIQTKLRLVDALSEGIRSEFAEFETASIRLPQEVTVFSENEILIALDDVLNNQRPPQQLKSVQKAVLRGTWKGQSYNEIADQLNENAASLKRQGAQLWQTLSKALGENLTKGNARNVLTQWHSQIGVSELVIRRSSRRARQYAENLGNGVELEMVFIPAGTFVMGAPKNEEGHSGAERPQHKVTFTAPFFIGKYPITQAQWRVVAQMRPVESALNLDPSTFKGEERPVETISWLDAVEFCARLRRYTGRDYRLPTEAEWEYSCRAGTTTPFHFGETIISDLANYRGTSPYGSGPQGEYREQTTNVGSFPANAFGLYDMHGNVLEWCQDHWHDNYDGAPTDNSVWLSSVKSKNRVLRGGSWSYFPEDCRSANRYRYPLHSRDIIIGLRVVCGDTFALASP